MEVNPKDPKTLMAAVVVVAGALAGGSVLGFTIEPEETTALRVANATLTERASNLEAQVEGLEGRVGVLEEIVADCSRVVAALNTPQ